MEMAPEAFAPELAPEMLPEAPAPELLPEAPAPEMLPEAPAPEAALPAPEALPEPAPEALPIIDVAATAVSPDQLPPAPVNESGMQVKTVLTARSIHAAFPEIHDMIGVRPDALRWHPNGLAVDVMIPNPSSPEGIALGDRIVNFVMQNAGRFGIQDAIWRGAYYTPGGVQHGGMGHYDHVHVTTIGG